MTINDKIMQSLDFLGFPVYPNAYPGEEDIYIVFNVNTSPDYFGDNEPGYDINFVQIHFFCPHTFNSIYTRKQIKKALQAAGFTYAFEVDASEQEGQHIVFECECVEAIE